MLFRIGALVTMLLIIFGCATSDIRDRQNLALVGHVEIPDKSAIPNGAKLHVLLTESNPEQADNKVVATGSKLVLGVENQIPFSIPYVTDAINSEFNYALLACLDVDDKVILISQDLVPVLSAEFKDTPVIMLDKKLSGDEVTDGHGFAGGNTALARGVQSNLADVCRQKLPGYDHVTQSRASKILPAEMLKSPLHQVREQVDIHGPHYFFVIDSKFGQFTAQGMTMLRKTIREIYAIEELKKIKGSEAYLKATADTAEIPFLEVKELVTKPVQTISGIPKGTLKLIATTWESLSAGRSQYEDSYVQALITVSKYKRRHAASLGVDVYLSNPLLQLELDRLGWTESLGNWTPSVAMLPLTGPGALAYSALSWTETLNRVLVEESPDFLREKNKRILKKLGIPSADIAELLSHRYFSPRHTTI